jgi:hypothetical protein
LSVKKRVSVKKVTMKKNQTDDLFARKLRQAQIEPRPEAWQKLQGRMQRQPLAWWQRRELWLVAAGLSLLLVAGWVVWKNQTPNKPEMAQKSPQKRPQSTSVQPLEQVPSIAQTQSAIQKQPQVKRFNSNSIPAQPQQMVSPLVEQPTIAQQTQPLETIETPKHIETAAVATEPAVVQNQPTTQAEKKVIMLLPEQPAAAVAAQALADLPLIETAPTQDKRKSTRFARIVRQMQNAKEGERVDWGEVGVNPNRILAKVTGRKNNSTDESNTTNQPQ